MTNLELLIVLVVLIVVTVVFLWRKEHLPYEVRDARTYRVVARFKTHWEAEQYIDEHLDDPVFIDD